MITRTLSRWLMSIALAVFAHAVLNAFARTSPAQGRPAAARTNCAGPIQACIDAASDGDTILIAAGRYTEGLTLNKPVSLTGVSSDTTIIHAVAGQRVLTVTGATISNSVVISGLTFTGGDVSNGGECPQFCGGGIAFLNAAQPRIRDVIIQDNRAAEGGGVYAEPDSPLFIDNSLLISNIAGNGGGGIYAGHWYTPGILAVSNTNFLSNVAFNGGGIYINGVASLTDIYFDSNMANSLGGGINARIGTLALTRTTFFRNNGSALYAENSPATIVDSYFEQNSGDIGGAIWMYYVGANISHTAFISNTAELGGGGVTMIDGSVVDSRFERNTVQEYWGGGLYAMGTTFITNTIFIDNIAQTHGGGAYFGNAEIYDSRFEGNIGHTGGGGGFFTFGLLLSNTDVISNYAGCGSWASDCGGGGIYAFNEATALNGRFEHNVSSGNGGGLYANNALMVANSVFINNAANGNGGGMYFASDSRVVNALFSNNYANLVGAALALTGTGHIDVLYTTIANAASDPNPAISVLSGTLNLTNTIIASHTIAISNAGGTVYEDYNLFFNNITSTISVTSGGHSLVGDPKFIDPVNGDYRLQVGSAAIDRGVDAGIHTDLDGNPRPVGAGFDIGAYEYQAIKVMYLPLIRK
ncbi:putative outer membrane protein PmpB [Thermoflexales bacterium]|nr:putative outer membrane protein PmpB [Thermoflexales bacterium]